jgi:hypothetical protein
MRYLTVRGIPLALDKALRDEMRRRAKSLNQTVIELLKQALGLDWDAPQSNGLEKLAGTWSKKELDRFNRATAVFEGIDEEEWR